LRLAALGPADVGANATRTVHVAAGARVTPEQVSAWIVNSAAFVPPSDVANTPDGAPPLFVTVNWMNPDVPPGDVAP